MRYLVAILLLGLSLPANAITCDFKKYEHGQPRDFARFIKKLQKVKTADQLSQYAKFPLKLNIRPKQKVLKNRAQLKKLNKIVMSDKVKKAIRTANIRFVYCDKQGVTLGKGNVWIQKFKDKYKIVAINP